MMWYLSFIINIMSSKFLQLIKKWHNFLLYLGWTVFHCKLYCLVFSLSFFLLSDLQLFSPILWVVSSSLIFLKFIIFDVEIIFFLVHVFHVVDPKSLLRLVFLHVTALATLLLLWWSTMLRVTSGRKVSI